MARAARRHARPISTARLHRRPVPPRATSAQRGYTQAWRELSAKFRREHPECARCGRPSEVVDHRIAHRGDMQLMWDLTNLVALCKRCHDRKTYREDGAFGRPRQPRSAEHPGV